MKKGGAAGIEGNAFPNIDCYCSIFTVPLTVLHGCSNAVFISTLKYCKH
jgi:hypothetical protein